MKTLIVVAILFLASWAQAREVSFSWEAMEGAKGYEIQLSPSKDFTTPIVTQKLKTPDFSATLNPGKYFYRVRVIDNGDHPGKWSTPSVVTVGAQTPVIIEPNDKLHVSYYDKPVEVKFAWKPIDLTAVYEITVRDGNGQEIIHTTIDKTEYRTSLGQGEYQWQLRSMGKSPIPGRKDKEDVPSEYTPSRSISVTKNSVTAPKLKTPLDGQKLVSHNPIFFTWEQDPHTPLTDVHIEQEEAGKSKDKSEKEGFRSPKVENVTGSSYTQKIEAPGKYKWSVVAKEDKSSPGEGSETREFIVLDDPLFAGNYEIEAGLGYLGDVYQTDSSLQTKTVNQIHQQSTSYGVQYGLSGGYYVFRSLGFFGSMKTASLGLENTSTSQTELDGTLRLRYGANGFFQEFWFGYRRMDIMEAENTPVSGTTDFVTTGPLVGTRLGAEVNSRIKIMVTAYYYRPISSNQSSNFGPTNFDVGGGSVGVKYNIKGQWWLGYRFEIERVTGQVTGLLSPPYVSSAWGMFRTEPVFLSVSYEK